MRAIKSRWQTSPGWAEIWEVVKNFCTVSHSIWTLVLENLSLCLNSHRDVQAGANLSFNRQFYDEHWSKHRVVTCMDWSLQVRCEVGRCFHITSTSPHKTYGQPLFVLLYAEQDVIFEITARPCVSESTFLCKEEQWTIMKLSLFLYMLLGLQNQDVVG